MGGDVDTGVMEIGTPVHVANKTGQEQTIIKDAVPLVQTAASKTMMVKLFFFSKEKQKSPFFHSFHFYRKCQLHPRISNTTWRKMLSNSAMFDKR